MNSPHRSTHAPSGGLGWNSDYCANCTKADRVRWGYGASQGPLTGFENEGFIKHIGDVMHGSVQPGGQTFQELGFTYVNMDS
jgi:hypothetical protein